MQLPQKAQFPRNTSWKKVPNPNSHFHIQHCKIVSNMSPKRLPRGYLNLLKIGKKKTPTTNIPSESFLSRLRSPTWLPISNPSTNMDPKVNKNNNK